MFCVCSTKTQHACAPFFVSALSNRREWEQKGQTIVAGYLEAFYRHQEEKGYQVPMIGQQATSSIVSSTTTTDSVPTFEDEITEEVEV